jgi:hypothetical protein
LLKAKCTQKDKDSEHLKPNYGKCTQKELALSGGDCDCCPEFSRRGELLPR